MFKKSLLLTLLLALIVPWAANAQETVTIGDLENAGNDTYLPMNSLYEYSYSQQIYTADEIGMAGTINSITVWLYGNANLYEMPFDIYMVETDKESFESTTDWVAVTSGDIVYSGSVTVHNTDAEAYTFNLETPFSYSGSGNLVIAFDNNTGQWKSGLNGKVFTATDNVNRALYARRDSNDYDPTNMSGVTASGNVAKRNVIEIDITPSGSGPTCAKPNGLAVETTGTSATFTWNSEATAFDVAHSMDATTDPNNCIVDQANTNSYQFTNLELGDHYVWVRANCGSDGYSDWSAKKFFHIGYCVPAPTSVDGNGISNVTFGTGDYVVNNDTPKATYADYTSQIGAVQAGVEATIAITFKTGYTYNTYVWVDLDNSLSFDADEVVCYGESTNANPSTLTLNFIIPATQTLGDFRMRIGSADNGLGSDPTAANPCYTGTYGCFQDYTLRVLEAPSCLTPTGLTASNVTAHGATITWTSDASAWEIQLNEEEAIEVTEATYTFTGLTAETAYSVKVRTNCDGIYSEWTNAISFTTTIACPAPMYVTVSNITGHTALLSWTEGGTANEWDVQWCTNPDFTYPYFSFIISENPSGQITGLNPETLYYVRVRAYCGDEDGESTWVNTNFTTIVACPAPTAAVSNITTTTATVSCTNTVAESFNVMLGDEVVAEDVTMPYTLTDLEENTTYTVKVQAICGGEDGESAWSAGTTFITAETCPDGMVCIGTGDATSSNLPAYNYYNYSYTQQIYTAGEIGMSGEISTIEFKNTGAEKTMTCDVYMKATSKTAFENSTDWVAMSEADLVFSGEITFVVGEWTTIALDVPFDYADTANLLVTVANVTGAYTSSPHIACLTFPATDQALYHFRDNPGAYDITAPGVNGTMPGFKNRIRMAIGEPPACPKPKNLTVNYTGGDTAEVSWTSDATAWNIDVNGTVTAITENPYTLTDLEMATAYTVQVQAVCDTLSEWTSTNFVTELCPPENMCEITIVLTDSYGDGWNGGELAVVDVLTDDVLGTYTIATGSTATYTLSVCDDRAINFVYTAGNYPTENGWSITDIGGDVIAEHEGCASGCAVGSGIVATYTVNCTETDCRRPTDLAVTNIGPHSAALSWTENSVGEEPVTQWVVAYMSNEIGFVIGDGTKDEDWTEVTVTDNPYTLTELAAETEYTWKVRPMCDVDDKWSLTNVFTTAIACPAPTITSVTPYHFAADVNIDSDAAIYDLEWAANSYTPSGDASWVQYDNGTNSENIGANVSQEWTWGVMYPASVREGKVYLTKVGIYEKAEYYTMESYTVNIYTGGDNAPGTLVATETVTPAGTDGIHEIELSTPIMIDSTQNLWITMTATGTFVMPACDTDEPNDQWVYSNGWFNLVDVAPSLAGYGWMIRAFIDAVELQWNTVTHITSPYTITGLEAETEYILRVKAICDGDDGVSDWTTTTFTTTEVPSIIVWDEPGDWPSGEIPPAGGDVIIPDNSIVIIPDDYTANVGEITIGTGSSIVIEQGGQLYHSNEIPVVMQMSVNGYSRNDNSGYNLITAPVYTNTIEYTIPVDNTNLNSGNFDLYTFDQNFEDAEWRNYKAGEFDALRVGQGYLYANFESTDILFAGQTMPTNADHSIELVYSDDSVTFRGWNLVGNPFTCIAYVERPFYTMSAGGDAIVEVNMDEHSVEVLQGIFVVADSTEVNPVVTFTTTEPSRSAYLALNLSQGRSTIDRAIVRFDEGRTLPKLQLNPNHTKVYIPMDGKDYAVAIAAEMGEMPVSFKAENNDTYTFSANTEEVNFNYLHLIDNMTGADVDLLQTPSYTFNARTTDYANRFKLVFATGNNSNNDNFAFFSNGSFVINNEGNATLQVIDAMGRIITSERINGSTSVRVNAAAGVYMLRLINGNNVKVQKIVVR